MAAVMEPSLGDVRNSEGKQVSRRQEDAKGGAMPIKVFICWSGTRSQRFSLAVEDLLKKVLGTVDISISTKIEKGTEWFDELRHALNHADCGVLCLTPEAIGSPWIHFEAGMLVCAL